MHEYSIVEEPNEASEKEESVKSPSPKGEKDSPLLSYKDDISVANKDVSIKEGYAKQNSVSMSPGKLASKPGLHDSRLEYQTKTFYNISGNPIHVGTSHVKTMETS